MTAHLERSDTPRAGLSGLALTITGEAVAYLVILAVAALLRFTDLGAMPLSDAEAYHALSALRTVDPDTPGPALPPASPALFAGQAAVMGLLGGDEGTARLFTALVGLGLALTPALWREKLGRLPALIFSALLALSPTAVAAARLNDGATLSAALAMLAVWLARRFAETRATPWAAALGIDLAALVLLVEPGGPLMALCLAAGAGFLWLLDEEGQTRAALVDGVRAFPWVVALLSAAASVALVATLLFLYPAGLSAVGEVLGDFVQGLGARPAGQTFAHPVLVLLFYEPLAWIFGVIGLVSAVGANRAPRPALRFLAGWALAALAIGLFYPGATSAHALLMILPLAALAARVIAVRLETPPVEIGEAASWEGMWQTPGWGLPAYIAGLAALAAAVYINLMIMGREMADLAFAATLQSELPRLVLAGLSLGLIVIVFFLVGATWGSRTAVRGFIMAAVFVLGAYTFSAAWGLAVFRADDPRELWYLDRPTRALRQLVRVVQDGSERDVGTPNTAPVAAQIPPDGALAWALRDFENLTFVSGPSAAITTPLVILPADDPEPVLGADYVGQGFVTRRTWRFDSVGLQGLLGWVLQRYAFTQPLPAEEYIVWMRTDVYGTAEAAPTP